MKKFISRHSPLFFILFVGIIFWLYISSQEEYKQTLYIPETQDYQAEEEENTNISLLIEEIIPSNPFFLSASGVYIPESDINLDFPEKEFHIRFWWDIMLSRSVWAFNKKYGEDRIFKNFFPNADIEKNTLLFYNLESPFTHGKDTDIAAPSFLFKSNPKNINVLNELKADAPMIISLANNHITNAGGEGIDTTIRLLNQYGIIPVGVGKNIPEIVEFEQEGFPKICLQAYSYDGGMMTLRNEENQMQNYVSNPLDINKILEDINLMKEKKCEMEIISLHWGREYKESPTINQKEIAHSLIDAGADLIIGHHSHVLWEVENYKWKYIYYSLWNFIFDQTWGMSNTGSEMDHIYDPKLGRETVPTYIGNTFDHHYYWDTQHGLLLEDIEQIKHRIGYGELEKYEEN